MDKLIEQAAAGCQKPMTLIYEKNRYPVLLICTVMLPEEDCSAAVTSVFEKVWKELPSCRCDNEDALSRWIACQAVAFCCGILEKKYPESFHTEPIAADVQYKKAIDAVSALQPRQKCAILYQTMGAADQSSLGTLLKMSQKQANRLAANALKQVRSMLPTLEGTGLAVVPVLREQLMMACADMTFPEAADQAIRQQIGSAQLTEQEVRRRKKNHRLIWLGAIVAIALVLGISIGAWLMRDTDGTETGETAETTETAETSAETETAETASAEQTSEWIAPSLTEDGDGVDVSGLNVSYYADIEIQDYGTITVALIGDEAPESVENFVSLAESGFYDGLTFHRIIEGFMMQGGDPNGDGTGGSDDPVTGEFLDNGVDNYLSHVRGAISMARSSDYDSGSSQFFICQDDCSSSLDGSYACFGYVTSGLSVVDAVCEAAQPTDNNGTISADEQPVITSITIRAAE